MGVCIFAVNELVYAVSKNSVNEILLYKSVAWIWAMHIVRRLDYFHSQKLQAKERNPNCYRVVCKHNFLLGTNNDSSGRANTFRTLLFQNAYLAKSVTIKDCCLKSWVFCAFPCWNISEFLPNGDLSIWWDFFFVKKSVAWGDCEILCPRTKSLELLWSNSLFLKSAFCQHYFLGRGLLALSVH